MSNRVRGFAVTFAKDVHPDFMEGVKRALVLFANVVSVQPLEADAMSQVTREQVRRELLMKLYDALEPKP